MPTAWADTSDWARTLLDTIYLLPASYAPSSLVPVSAAGLTGVGSVRGFVIADLAALGTAAAAAGSPIAIVSAYRSYATQVATFDSAVAQSGLEQALLTTARPGHSEHQLGTTIDVAAAGTSVFATDFGATTAGAWMRDHAWEYGFLMSYPEGVSPGITCYSYEPWHFRFVGRSLAAAIRASGLTTREYLWYRGASIVSPDLPGDAPSTAPSLAPVIQAPAVPQAAETVPVAPDTPAVPVSTPVEGEPPDLLVPGWMLAGNWSPAAPGATADAVPPAPDGGAPPGSSPAAETVGRQPDGPPWGSAVVVALIAVAGSAALRSAAARRRVGTGPDA